MYLQIKILYTLFRIFILNKTKETFFMFTTKKDNLTVKVYDTRRDMGLAAGKEIADCIKERLKTKE